MAIEKSPLTASVKKETQIHVEVHRPRSSSESMQQPAEDLSCLHTCTATLNLSKHYLKLLYVKMLMSKSVGLDIKWILHPTSVLQVRLCTV